MLLIPWKRSQIPSLLRLFKTGAAELSESTSLALLCTTGATSMLALQNHFTFLLIDHPDRPSFFLVHFLLVIIFFSPATLCVVHKPFLNLQSSLSPTFSDIAGAFIPSSSGRLPTGRFFWKKFLISVLFFSPMLATGLLFLSSILLLGCWIP